MTLIFPLTSSLASAPGSIQLVFEQPTIVGKVFIAGLMLLSIFSWVKIVSKWVQLVQFKRADEAFSARLRQSKTTLELFEQGWHGEGAGRFLIYLAGARETVFQFLGTREPVEAMEHQIQDAGLLPAGKARILDRAFDAGFRQSAMSIRSGIRGYILIGTLAILLGLVGGVWTMMVGFGGLEEGSGYGGVIGSGLGILITALLVASPAFIARIAFGIHIERRVAELAKFKEDLTRLFERKFIDFDSGSDRAPAVDSSAQDSDDGERAPQMKRKDRRLPSHGRKRQYHSIRERLLRPPSQDSQCDERQIGSIAHQTVGSKA